MKKTVMSLLVAALTFAAWRIVLSAQAGAPPTTVNVMNGPSGNGTAGAGAYSRKVQEGDIIIIPTGVGHGWSQVTDHVTYLSVRPDPDRVLPAGYVYPLLLKNQPTPVK